MISFVHGTFVCTAELLSYSIRLSTVQYVYGTLPRSRSSRWPRGRTGKAGGHPAHRLAIGRP